MFYVSSSANLNRNGTVAALENMRPYWERLLDFTEKNMKFAEGEQDRTIMTWLDGFNHSGYLANNIELENTFKTCHDTKPFLASEEYAHWKSNHNSSLLIKSGCTYK
jgi:hypothetical protein